jgi:membrane fusion protein (multidrug efflux system)
VPALLIPEQSLVPEGNEKYVFAVRDGKAVRTQVHTGRRRPGEVEIIDGLVDGDVVIVEGTQKVRDGLPVNPVADPVPQGASLAPALRRERA